MEPIHPMFTALTHLDLLDSLDIEFESLSLKLALFLANTHLALLFIDVTVAETILSTNLKLGFLIRKPCSSLSLDDSRFICIPWPYETYQDDWITGINGELDLWARADLFVTKKPDARK
jgi:hypothetical protein